MTPTWFLVALLSLAPSEDAGEAPAPTAEGASDAATSEYQAALERVRTAERMANEEPERGAVQLRDALQILRDFGPDLAQDPEGQDLRTTAMLKLSRALLSTEDADGAREVMDEAIRTARGDPLPTKEFGPGIAALYKERASVLAKLGVGSIEVNCKVPCSIYINERPTQPLTEGLIPGRYRVWVRAKDPSQDPDVQQTVEVSADRSTTLDFGREPVAPPPVEEPKVERLIMPRWAEVVLMTAGAAGVGVGAALWAIDGSCPNGADPEDVVACPQVYVTKTAGIITLSLGGAALLGGTITLAVDEVHVKKRRGTQATLGWKIRF